MNKKLQHLFIPINGFLFSLISLFSIFNENISQTDLSQIVRPLLICFFVIFFIGLVVFHFWHSTEQKTLFLTILCFLFFVYGHLLVLLEKYGWANLAKHRILMPVFVILAILGLFFVLKQPASRLQSINRGIFGIFSILIILNIINVGSGIYKNQQYRETVKTSTNELPQIDQQKLANAPDIYWFVLDGYERKDSLSDNYGFDNSDFLNELKKRGFVIPKCSLSNYTLTALSLSTALNMDYIENLTDQPLLEKDHLEYRLFREMIKNSRLRTILENYGYKTVAFPTEFSFTEITDADYYLQIDNKSFFNDLFHPRLTNFEEMFFGTSMGKLILDMPTPMKRNIASLIGDPTYSKYELVMNGFEKVKTVPELPGRKFVFAHFMATHEPFVLDQNARYKYEQDLSKGYITNVQATNTKMLAVIDELMQKSKVPPVIILQGDHAYSETYKNKILNAYYLPGVDSHLIDEKITPINSFRLVLQSYLGLPFEQIDNRSFLSANIANPTDFSPVSGSCYSD